MRKKEILEFTSFPHGEKEHVISVLEQTKNALTSSDVFKLKELSNQTIHTASTEQDTDSITLAILIYSLSKVVERKYQYEKACTGFCKYSMRAIERAVEALKNDDGEKFRRCLRAKRRVFPGKVFPECNRSFFRRKIFPPKICGIHIWKL